MEAVTINQQDYYTEENLKTEYPVFFMDVVVPVPWLKRKRYFYPIIFMHYTIKRRLYGESGIQSMIKRKFPTLPNCWFLKGG